MKRIKDMTVTEWIQQMNQVGIDYLFKGKTTKAQMKRASHAYSCLLMIADYIDHGHTEKIEQELERIRKGNMKE